MTGAPLYVVCAVSRDGEEFLFTPFGHLADGDPYDTYLPPPPEEPFFPQPIRANLLQSVDDKSAWGLHWNRPPRRGERD